MWQKARGREPKLDRPAKRQTYYESVFGRPRVGDLPAPVEKGKEKYADKEKAGKEKDAVCVDEAKATLPDVPLDDDLDAERQWLGVGDRQKYDLHVGYLQRERSEGLEKQFEKELTRRGYIDRRDTSYRLLCRAELRLQPTTLTSVLLNLRMAPPDIGSSVHGGATSTIASLRPDTTHPSRLCLRLHDTRHDSLPDPDGTGRGIARKRRCNEDFWMKRSTMTSRHHRAFYTLPHVPAVPPATVILLCMIMIWTRRPRHPSSDHLVLRLALHAHSNGKHPCLATIRPPLQTVTRRSTAPTVSWRASSPRARILRQPLCITQRRVFSPCPLYPPMG